MQRVIGFLMIVAVILPLLLGGATVIVADQIAGKVQTTITTRVDRINTKLDQVETTIDTVSTRFTELKNVADQINTSANSAAQSVLTTINNFKIHYGGLQWPAGVPLPNIPPVDLDVPGLSAARDFIQNLYNSLGSLTSALSDVSLIGQVPGQFGEAVTEMQGMNSDLVNIIAPYTQILLTLVVGLVVWLAILYIVIAYRWLRQGWAMLTGQPLTNPPLAD